MHSTGALRTYAVLRPAVLLSTPGPGTTEYAPTRPLASEYPSAMYEAPCSCRAVMSRTRCDSW